MHQAGWRLVKGIFVNMSRSNRVFAALTIVVVSACAARSSLASIVVDASYFNGFRTTVGTSGMGGGLTWNPAAGKWSAGKFSISWEIVDNGSDFTYKYTVKTLADSLMSHWILELSEFDAVGNLLETHWEDVFVALSTPGNYINTGIGPIVADDVGLTGSKGGNPGMPDVDDGNPLTPDDKDDIFGVRFTRGENEMDTTTVIFTTPEVPIWGDFYAKDGGDRWAYNTGFGIDPTTTDFANWIPRPDGMVVIPEPATFIVWSLLGVLGLGWWHRRKAV